MKHKSPILTLLLILAALTSSFALAGEKPDYIGEWSNGRGETLTITAKTIQFADNKPVPYRDITRGSDGSSFQLEITATGSVNAFPGKFLEVSIDGEEMKIRQFR